MRKYIMFFLPLFLALMSQAQEGRVYAKVQITSIYIQAQNQREQTLKQIERQKQKTSKQIELSDFGTSEIVSLGKLNGMEVGLQLSLLKSSMGDSTMLVSGMALYTRKDGLWKMHAKPTYSATDYKIIEDSSFISDKDFTWAGT